MNIKRIVSFLLAVLLSFGIFLSFTACTEEEIGETIKVIDDILTETDEPTENPTDEPTATAKAEITATAKHTSTPKRTATPKPTQTQTAKPKIDRNGTYDDRDNVALYIKTYGFLPPNYMSKEEAEGRGWSGGALDRVIKGYAIGGDRFGNYEKKLPTGNTYYECDIDTIGQKDRGTKRIVYTKDRQIYYTSDHYKTFLEYQEDGTWK